MSDREILRKYINLDNTCLSREKKEEVINMLYKCKDAFSLRDKIGTCPNIEVGIEVTDKSPFFIRPYHVREEDKKVIDKEMKCLCRCRFLILFGINCMVETGSGSQKQNQKLLKPKR